MNVLIASSEAYPLIKVGGLADVVGALPKALRKIGVDARLILPKYKGIDEQKFPMIYKNLKVKCQMSSIFVEGEIVETRYDGVIVYLVENERYFFRDYVYGTPEGDYLDNAERFVFFSKAVIEAVKSLDFLPEVIHCNDWETALIPFFLKTLYKEDPVLKDIATLLTIHNIGYQGIFPRHEMPLLDVGWEYFTPENLEFYGMINFLKGGILYADILSTVSKRYAEEIQTEEFGFGLQGVIKKRKDDLYGVINGIDTEEWNPKTDPYIPERYDKESIEKKLVSKRLLQETFNLERTDLPLLSSISRLTEQKGIELIIEALPEILSLDVQYIILGEGETRFVGELLRLSENFKGRFSVKIGYEEGLAHLIEAGSDIFLMPSAYEPCGLNQLYSLRYGTIPVVHAVGGLDETILDYNLDPEKGTGFKFHKFSKDALLNAIKRALILYENREEWKRLIKRCMEQDFSWERQVLAYKELYEKAKSRHGLH